MLILTITQLDITLEFNLIYFILFYFGYISACNLVFVFVRVTTGRLL